MRILLDGVGFSGWKIKFVCGCDDEFFDLIRLGMRGKSFGSIMGVLIWVLIWISEECFVEVFIVWNIRNWRNDNVVVIIYK